MAERRPIQVRKLPERGIFCFTETSAEKPKRRLKDIVRSCDELQKGVANVWKRANTDVRKSLEDYSSTLSQLHKANTHKWRNQERYSTTRNRIISILSGKKKAPDKEEEDAFTYLLFPRRGKASITPELTSQFKFSVPEVLSPRMTHLMQVNRRPFGSNFTPLMTDTHYQEREDWSPDFLAKFLREEIGKYNVKRIDRLFRVPEKLGMELNLREQEGGKTERREEKADPLSMFLLTRKRKPTYIQRKEMEALSPLSSKDQQSLESTLQGDSKTDSTRISPKHKTVKFVGLASEPTE